MSEREIIEYLAGFIDGEEEDMKIKIENRLTGKVILSGEYESLKECLEKNRGANLASAYLEGAYLVGADLVGANLEGAYLRDANLAGADFRGAYFRDADLVDANFRGADLAGANLASADLRGAKSYSQSHDFCMEIIHRQDTKTFTDKEWAVIGEIMVHRFCWDKIKKDFPKEALQIAKKLTEAGFNEYEKRWKI